MPTTTATATTATLCEYNVYTCSRRTHRVPLIPRTLRIPCITQKNPRKKNLQHIFLLGSARLPRLAARAYEMKLGNNQKKKKHSYITHICIYIVYISRSAKSSNQYEFHYLKYATDWQYSVQLIEFWLTPAVKNLFEIGFLCPGRPLWNRYVVRALELELKLSLSPSQLQS